METLKQLIHQLTDVETLVLVGGLTAITAIVFSETGLMVGFFLPGDSLLVTAGVFAATGQLSIWTLNVLAIAAAIAGDTLGYWVGRKAGPALFARPKSRFFNPAHLKRAHDFYEKHGGKTLIVARFTPVVRSFAPLVAGAGEMDLARFQLFNVIGAGLWVLTLVGGGYLFGNVPFIKDNLSIILIIGILAVVAPIVAATGWRLLRAWRSVGEGPDTVPLRTRDDDFPER